MEDHNSHITESLDSIVNEWLQKANENEASKISMLENNNETKVSLFETISGSVDNNPSLKLEILTETLQLHEIISNPLTPLDCSEFGSGEKIEILRKCIEDLTKLELFEIDKNIKDVNNVHPDASYMSRCISNDTKIIEDTEFLELHAEW
ncbi:21696_t:CDS:2, partial [Dentiscutata erythropus]